MRLTMEDLADPMGVLRTQLSRTGRSSREISEETGLSASSIRAIRNEQTETCRVDLWARLMVWADKAARKPVERAPSKMVG